MDWWPPFNVHPMLWKRRSPRSLGFRAKGAFDMLFEAAERGNLQGRHFATVGALGHLAILLAATHADDAALLLGMWSEHTAGNLDTSHPLFAGLSERYDTLMSDLTSLRREELLRRVAPMDDFEILAVVRQHLDALTAEP
jgi:hypothetical protein